MKRRSFLQALLGSVVAPWASVAMSRNTPGYTGTPIGDDIMDRIYTIPPVGVEVYESEFGVYPKSLPTVAELATKDKELREDMEAVYLQGGSHVPRVSDHRLYRNRADYHDWLRDDIPVAK
jgi:hypothetical protein